MYLPPTATSTTSKTTTTKVTTTVVVTVLACCIASMILLLVRSVLWLLLLLMVVLLVAGIAGTIFESAGILSVAVPAVAAVMAGKVGGLEGMKVACVVSGSNIKPDELLREVFQAAE